MITIAMIYKTGGDYQASDVDKLARAVRRNLTVPHKIVCLTDVPTVVYRAMTQDKLLNAYPLNHDLPGWLSKMELFKIHGPLLCFDLDTIISGNIDMLAEWVLQANSDKDLLMLRGFYRQDQCSGILGWKSSLHWIFSRFVAQTNIKFAQTSNGVNVCWGKHTYRGDQEWLRALVTSQLNVTMAQDVQLGIRSYKVHIKDNEQQALPFGTNIVCFHGKPRPCEVDPVPDWMKRHWYA